MPHGRKIAVIGLGYVGLPVAVAFARSRVPVVGFDIDRIRIDELRAGHDRSREIEPSDLHHPTLRYESEPAALAACDFFIVTVPTRSTRRTGRISRDADGLATVGERLKPGGVVVYESTVYPGAVEEDCVPVLEQISGLKVGRISRSAIRPSASIPATRRIASRTSSRWWPGLDAQHARSRRRGLRVGGQGRRASRAVDQGGGSREGDRELAARSQHRVHERTVGDLAMLRIDTGDVLAAARTKWNFLPFVPGLVGGHCIGVDPYYLTHRAEKAGYHPR